MSSVNLPDGWHRLIGDGVEPDGTRAGINHPEYRLYFWVLVNNGKIVDFGNSATSPMRPAFFNKSHTYYEQAVQLWGPLENLIVGNEQHDEWVDDFVLKEI